MHRIDIKRFREQAARMLALASAARMNGDFEYVAQLVQRAAHYLDMVAAAESSAEDDKR
jgi:hypothetical protein